ncbi:MAG: glycosyltransferase [Fibrobacter sp.]|nr:glycosyltransferase [Fibrobacter sp.]
MSIAISVIIPVYKVSLNYLRDCFNSLTAQTTQNCEFIIVSDGAPEAECSICEEYAAKDSRFKYFKREHAGVSATRNFGIKQAQGEYISFVDSDDYVEQNYLSFLSHLQTSSDIIFFNYTFQFQDKIIPIPFPQSTFATDKKLIQDCLLKLFGLGKYDHIGYTWNKFFKRSLININKIYFPEELSFMEDYVFTLQYCQHLSSLYINDEKLYHYRLSKKGLTFAKLDSSIYYDVSVKLTQAVKNYPSIFKDAITNVRILFLHFLSIIKQKGIISYQDYKVFRETYAKERNDKFNCLTLRTIFAFPPHIAYALCYVYKMLCWLPGLKFPSTFR